MLETQHLIAVLEKSLLVGFSFLNWIIFLFNTTLLLNKLFHKLRNLKLIQKFSLFTFFHHLVPQEIKLAYKNTNNKQDKTN